jgi:hypothetical protein
LDYVAISALLTAQHAILSIVQLLVTTVPHVVIIELFDHGYAEHEDQWCHVGEKETYFQEWDELRQCNQEEKEILEELELIPEHFWHE